MNLDLTGKVAIVTGAGSGIGLEVARLYLESGADVVAVDLDLSTAVSGWPDGPGRLRTVLGDVALGETADRYAAEAMAAFGRIDVMVNNAGVALTRAIVDVLPDEWDRVMAVNVKSLYWSARAVVPIMRKQKDGLFLNTGSISSVVGIPGQGVYGPSKGALVQVTRQMAIEYAEAGIRCNAVCPGTVDTPLLRQAAEQSGDPAGFLKGLQDAHPIGRIASAEEVARFYVFLASDHARFMTGAVLMIDGGFTAR